MQRQAAVRKSAPGDAASDSATSERPGLTRGSLSRTVTRPSPGLRHECPPSHASRSTAASNPAGRTITCSRNIPAPGAEGRVRGDLINAGWGAAGGYLGLIPRDDGPWVTVQVFESESLADAWQELDAFEGSEYRRVLIPVYSGGRGCAAALFARTSTRWRRSNSRVQARGISFERDLRGHRADAFPTPDRSHGNEQHLPNRLPRLERRVRGGRLA